MPSAVLTRIFETLSLIGSLVLIVRLLRTGLWKSYPIFFSYFVFRIPNSLWPLYVQNHTSVYQHVWMLTEPITWIFHVLIVFELCRLVLQGHRGIFTLGRWAMLASLVVAIGISILSLLPHLTARMSYDTRWLRYELASQRGIDFALAIFLLLLLFFLSRYPVRLSRNVLLHAMVYTLFFFAGALVVLLHTLFPGHAANSSLATLLTGFSCACIFAWIFLLTRKGEKIERSFPTVSLKREQHALRQLEALNATLLKVSGR